MIPGRIFSMAFGGKVRVVRSIALAIILVMMMGDFSLAFDRKIGRAHV